MKLYLLLTNGAFLLLFFVIMTHGSKICYEAKTCMHSGEERCGVNSAGKFRRFLDSCDIKEYNCLKGTDYKKTHLSQCNSLPPIPPEDKH